MRIIDETPTTTLANSQVLLAGNPSASITWENLMAQIQAHLMSHQYDSLLKKANLKGGRPGGLLR